MTGVVCWFTGLPSSGKSTLAAAVAGELRLRDISAVTLDSDDLRALAPAFVEVFVDTPIAECRRRDTKGLYERDVAEAPGAGVSYEPPITPDVRVQMGDTEAAAEIADRLAEMA
jgi:adenylylsulfate kinase-like enzyme